MSEKPDMKWLTDRTMHLVSASMDRDADTVTNLLAEISERYGERGIYGVCCALAAIVLKLGFPSVQRGDGSLTGDMLAIETTPGRGPETEEPHSLWAGRFVVAYANGDMDNADALFFGSIDDEDLHCGGVISLIALTADIARQVEAER